MPKFQVRVNSFGSDVISIVKTLRTIAILGLADAKCLSDYLKEHTPCVVVAGIAKDVADHVAQMFNEAGAEAVVEDSSLDTPLLLCPEAAHRHRWKWLTGPIRIDK